MKNQMLMFHFNSLHADYAIEWESSYAEYFALSLVVVVRSAKKSDSYPLHERRLNWLLYDEVNYLNLQLKRNEELMGRLAVAGTGYVEVIVLGWVAGEFLVHLFYYSTPY